MVGGRSLGFFIIMLAVSKGLPRKIKEDFRSGSLDPIPVLAIFVKLLVSTRKELLLDRSLRLRWSGG